MEIELALDRLPAFDEDATRQRNTRLRDEELLRQVLFEASDLHPVAVELARRELTLRGYEERMYEIALKALKSERVQGSKRHRAREGKRPLAAWARAVMFLDVGLLFPFTWLHLALRHRKRAAGQALAWFVYGLLFKLVLFIVLLELGVDLRVF